VTLDERPALDPARLVRETVYGSRLRLEWMLGHLRRDDTILEVGCGTGYMLCRPLAQLGYRVHGIDLDVPSIEHGKELLRQEGLDAAILSAVPLAGWPGRPDVVVASEVLEHLQDGELETLLGEIRERLAPGGRLLVTVPNGYGWFELEQFAWWKLGIGSLLFRSGINHLIEKTKTRWLGREAIDAGPPSTLSGSPHVQRFTLGSIRRRLRDAGFVVDDARGSVAVSGPFSNLLFAGLERALAVNARLGRLLGRFASGYFVVCRADGLAPASVAQTGITQPAEATGWERPTPEPDR
jgi:SAM-dependent methyltransferase